MTAAQFTAGTVAASETLRLRYGFASVGIAADAKIWTEPMIALLATKCDALVAAMGIEREMLGLGKIVLALGKDSLRKDLTLGIARPDDMLAAAPSLWIDTLLSMADELGPDLVQYRKDLLSAAAKSPRDLHLARRSLDEQALRRALELAPATIAHLVAEDAKAEVERLTKALAKAEMARESVALSRPEKQYPTCFIDELKAAEKSLSLKPGELAIDRVAIALVFGRKVAAQIHHDLYLTSSVLLSAIDKDTSSSRAARLGPEATAVEEILDKLIGKTRRHPMWSRMRREASLYAQSLSVQVTKPAVTSVSANTESASDKALTGKAGADAATTVEATGKAVPPDVNPAVTEDRALRALPPAADGRAASSAPQQNLARPIPIFVAPELSPAFEREIMLAVQSGASVAPRRTLSSETDKATEVLPSELRTQQPPSKPLDNSTPEAPLNDAGQPPGTPPGRAGLVKDQAPTVALDHLPTPVRAKARRYLRRSMIRGGIGLRAAARLLGRGGKGLWRVIAWTGAHTATGLAKFGALQVLLYGLAGRGCAWSVVHVGRAVRWAARTVLAGLAGAWRWAKARSARGTSRALREQIETGSLDSSVPNTAPTSTASSALAAASNDLPAGVDARLRAGHIAPQGTAASEALPALGAPQTPFPDPAQSMLDRPTASNLSTLPYRLWGSLRRRGRVAAVGGGFAVMGILALVVDLYAERVARNAVADAVREQAQFQDETRRRLDALTSEDKRLKTETVRLNRGIGDIEKSMNSVLSEAATELDDVVADNVERLRRLKKLGVKVDMEPATAPLTPPNAVTAPSGPAPSGTSTKDAPGHGEQPSSATPIPSAVPAGAEGQPTTAIAAEGGAGDAAGGAQLPATSASTAAEGSGDAEAEGFMWAARAAIGILESLSGLGDSRPGGVGGRETPMEDAGAPSTYPVGTVGGDSGETVEFSQTTEPDIDILEGIEFTSAAEASLANHLVVGSGYGAAVSGGLAAAPLGGFGWSPFSSPFEPRQAPGMALRPEADRVRRLLGELSEQLSVLKAIPSLVPVNGWLSSGYGKRRSPFSGAVVMHQGLDIAAPVGTEIRAPADGIVVFSGRQGGYGNCVMIAHGGGVMTAYGHNSRNLVKEGAVVKKGDVIARVGSTGSSTGPHLHFETRVNGKPVDPRHFIDLPRVTQK